MAKVHLLGIDIGKNTFHLVGHDIAGREVIRHKFTRQKLLQFLSCCEPAIVAMEACGGCHWLARKCVSYGHRVKLIPAQYVRPYVKINKNDFIDADAIAEASSRLNMRFTSSKTETAQIITVIRRTRSGFIKERTSCMNRIGSMLLEFGISLPRGRE